jgi:hypothetical protein
MERCVFAVLGACLALAGCTTSPPAPEGTAATEGAPASLASGPQRELTPQEKRVIVEAIALSIRDAASAKYRWAKFPVAAADKVNYCGTVDAKSPFPAYSGHQAYIVEAKVVGGHVSSAVVGLIAGGKDAALVSKMCAKYGLNPNDAT